jgi:hypothetical protein
MRDNDNLTSMCYWWPLVQGLDVPLPRTEIIEVGDGTLQDWMYACMDGPEHDPEHKATGGTWLPDVKHRAEAFGFPLFLRNDMCSGKHGYQRTCCVPNAESFKQHLFSLMEEIELQSVWGLPNRAVVLRELLTPCPGFVAFEGLPIGRERRYFIRDGAVECHHPYWPEEAFEGFAGEQDGWQTTLVALSDEAGDIDLLTGYAEQLASRLAGYWSVDFFCDANGKWWFIDAAVGEVSWHPDCSHNPERVTPPQQGFKPLTVLEEDDE